jgi:DNA mismatch endonuclease (patch repair protein)
MRPPKPEDPKRSALMARVRQKGTRAELTVASALRALGHSYRLNVKGLPGAPDFANKRRRWAIFVNGCFWHHHSGCRRATVPKANETFWRTKFTTNRARDARNLRALRKRGFRTGVLWECELTDEASIRARLSKILEPRRVDVG